MQRHLDDQDAYIKQMAAIPHLKRSGMTVEKIAAQFGTSVRPVLARLKAAGISKADLYTADDLDHMKRLHDGGSTIPDIHAAIGKGTEQAVRYRLHQMGCTSKKVMSWTRHPRTLEIRACMSRE